MGEELGIADEIDVANSEATQADKLRILLCAWCAEKGPRVRQGRRAMPSHVAQGGEEHGVLHTISPHGIFGFAHPAPRIAHDTLHVAHDAFCICQSPKGCTVKSGLFLLGCAPSLHPTSQHRRGDNGTMVRTEIDWPSCLHSPAPLPPLSSTLHSFRSKIRGSALWK